ncbi:MAG: kynureninase [Candidatus Latescibacteria bacterium]|nr:kynureninase [bacterium]MBD3423546.1 kynureninase [Candidatus Latescibacterota bacterium]
MEFSEELDRRASLREVRDLFKIPDGTIYMLGNSLGLLSAPSRSAVSRVLDEWENLAIKGWLEGEPPWFWMAERLGKAAAGMVGAKNLEVICTGSTTFNIHSMVSTFYKPSHGRSRIVAAADDFSSDIYALKSQISLKGMDWREHLILVQPDRRRQTSEERIEQAITEEVALVLLPSVFYRSSQLLDMERITAHAHRKGAIIGFDCSHSVGVVPHRFDDFSPDFALWCSYKYLCGGPGSPAFIYINSEHFDLEPGVAGWFGNVKETQFDLRLDFEHTRSAGGWQVSSPGILSAAGVEGALEIILDAGIERIREKSLKMTSYLIFLVDQLLSGEPYDFDLITPREPEKRGGHVALSRKHDASRIKEALHGRGVITDFRPPDIIRLAPSPLYNTYREIREVVEQIREIIDTGEYLRVSPERKIIS